jgi:hypothetical protein
VTLFLAAGIRGFETTGDRALAGAAPVSTCVRPMMMIMMMSFIGSCRNKK